MTPQTAYFFLFNRSFVPSPPQQDFLVDQTGDFLIDQEGNYLVDAE